MVDSTSSYATDDQRWLAVSSRDGRADEAFVYSVSTTGVYSRPSCVSRPARRENVVFFDTAEQARRAGFRPCRRCRPDAPPLSQQYADVVRRACETIDCADRPPPLDELASAAGFSRFHFHRVFKAVTGVTPRSYAAARRAQRMRTELTQSSTVTEAIYSAGFSSHGHFYATSSEMLGMTPTDFRSGGIGLRIRFHVAACSSGRILVAVTDRGVCAILVDDHTDKLVGQLAKQFPQAELTVADGRFAAQVKRIVARAERALPGKDLPREARVVIMRQLVGDALRAGQAG